MKAGWYRCSLATMEIGQKSKDKKLFDLLYVNCLRDNLQYKRYLSRYCVTATRYLRKTLYRPKKASVQPWIPIHCLLRVEVG